MIRRNNPSIDVEALGAVVRSRARSLREQPELATRESFAHFRAAEAFLERAEELNQPRTRIPHRLAKFGSLGRLFTSTYNLALRPLREANALQIEALRELMAAGIDAMKRIEQLEREIERLRNKE